MGWTTTYDARSTREEVVRSYIGDPETCATCGWGEAGHPRVSGSEYDELYGARTGAKRPAPHEYQRRGELRRLVDYSQVGWTEVYLAVQDIDTGEVWAGVCLVNRSHGSLSMKELSETMGPFYYRCPERILDVLTPTDSESANTWRAKCREYHAARKARPKIRAGDTVRFAAPIRFSNGAELDTLQFVRGSTFSDGWGRYRVSNWRDMPYQSSEELDR